MLIQYNMCVYVGSLTAFKKKTPQDQNLEWAFVATATAAGGPAYGLKLSRGVSCDYPYPYEKSGCSGERIILN